MNADIFAEWLRRQGRFVIRSESSYWVESGPRVLQAFPYHWVIQPTERELRELMLRHSILSLRYSTPLENPEGIISYHVVLTPPYSMDLLSTKVRNRLRKGLRECRVQKIPLNMLANEGWKLQKNTLERQGRLDSMSQSEWGRICVSAEGLEGFEAWGSFIKGQLAASLLMCCIDDIYYILYVQSDSNYLRLYVNNALFYSAICNTSVRKGVSGMFGNLQSLDAPESVSEFKFHMGFKAKPVRQRVVFHPLVATLLNPITHAIITRFQNWVPGSYILDKTEGMLRFYLQGQLPLADQDWPGCLVERKRELLAKSHQSNV